MRRVMMGLVVLAAVVGCGLYGSYLYLQSLLDQPIMVSSTTVYEVKPGANLRGVLRDWAAKDWLQEPDLSYRALRLEGRGALMSGAYTIEPSMSLSSLVSNLERGRVVTLSLTIVEGTNRWQLRDQLDRDGWIDADTFDALCDDREFLKSHGVPGPNCEGYLFPETYQFAQGTSAKSLFGTFLGAWRKAIDEVTAVGRGPLDFDDRAFTTLASIVEKETGAASERPRIACVFYNRMKESPPWRLETDPTVIYAATLADPNFDGNIKRSHLRTFDHPYNTYKRRGLPPGPIANAGRAALEAVRSPMNCNDFFFVSMNNGEHVFCPTYACHQTAVNKWQIQYWRNRRKK